jgi:hypothetical protein
MLLLAFPHHEDRRAHESSNANSLNSINFYSSIAINQTKEKGYRVEMIMSMMNLLYKQKKQKQKQKQKQNKIKQTNMEKKKSLKQNAIN